jgi:carbamoyl-phosphate synthase large subunit
VDLCVNKFLSYERWKSAGIKVPETLMLHTPEDLRTAFRKLGGRVWLRAVEGGGGSGALPTNSLDFGQRWIEQYKGWGGFSASAMLTPRSITFLSLWHEGKLIVAQTRRRRSWNFGDRTLSGVSGITGVGETCSDPVVTEVSLNSIQAIDHAPHGIFGVDLTYDDAGAPNPTEINIGRFFTTHYFFTKAGLNLPEIYVNIAMDGNFPTLSRTINPLPDGLVWIRGMDVEPVLTTAEELDKLEAGLHPL